MVHPLKLNQYLDLDPHVDVEGLLSIHDYLTKAIASSYWAIGANANGREDGLVDSGFLERTHQADLDLKAKVDGLNFDARQRYFLLQHNAGFLGYSVRVVIAHDFLLKYDPSKCESSPDAPKFEALISWIKAQDLFDMFGRIVVFISPPGIIHPAHYDYRTLGAGEKLGKVDEFIWLRTKKSKQFGLYDNDTPRNYQPIESFTAWFNNDQYHGGPVEQAKSRWDFF